MCCAGGFWVEPSVCLTMDPSHADVAANEDRGDHDPHESAEAIGPRAEERQQDREHSRRDGGDPLLPTYTRHSRVRRKDDDVCPYAFLGILMHRRVIHLVLRNCHPLLVVREGRARLGRLHYRPHGGGNGGADSDRRPYPRQIHAGTIAFGSDIGRAALSLYMAPKCWARDSKRTADPRSVPASVAACTVSGWFNLLLALRFSGQSPHLRRHPARLRIPSAPGCPSSA